MQSADEVGDAFETEVPHTQTQTERFPLPTPRISPGVITQQSAGARKYLAATCYFLVKSTKLQNN